MVRDGYRLGDTIDEVIKNLGVDKKKVYDAVGILKKDGYSDRGICYAAARSADKLIGFAKDDRFTSVLVNEVRKRSYKNGEWPHSTKSQKLAQQNRSVL